MKPSKELIGYLKTKTIDPEGYPLLDQAQAVLPVGIMRTVISLLEFRRKDIVPNEEEPLDVTS
jgi:hypothetical protein